uniref:Uncharacterized protein n=1 Tax=CrAss-like virus sp. ctUXy6 TaxID=2825835 RepID=A0A8S5V7H2_9CAUD|nr:MAG TPA: hypothetical protein [CrAss-like virus sp. ctUXy6]
MRDYGKVCLTERIGVCVEDDVDRCKGYMVFIV